jgi:hypothetical protein
LARSLVNTSPPISAPAVAGADVPAAAVIWSETLAASRDEFISSSQKISGDAAHAEKPEKQAHSAMRHCSTKRQMVMARMFFNARGLVAAGCGLGRHREASPRSASAVDFPPSLQALRAVTTAASPRISRW